MKKKHDEYKSLFRPVVYTIVKDDNNTIIKDFKNHSEVDAF